VYHRKIFIWSVLVIGIPLAGYAVSSGILGDLSVRAGGIIVSEFRSLVDYHCFHLQREGRHYFLLPDAGYTPAFVSGNWSAGSVISIIGNAFLNFIFQPVFLCVFTPQVVLNIILFPFFIYGAYKYFNKVPVLIVLFLSMGLYISIYGSIVEALIRHRMPCELIYIMIGLAGFARSITEN